MPPDVLLALASSGITLVASLMFFVSEDFAPSEAEAPPVAFCLPPARSKKAPPPLPVMPECAVNLSNAVLHSVMTLKPQGEEWVITLDTVPMADMPALQVREDGEGVGSVHDLRWHGKAGVTRATRRTWKQKPGQA